MQASSNRSFSHSRALSSVARRYDCEPKPSPVDLNYVRAGAVLFQAGDERHVFRVESGAISHFMQWSDGRCEVIAFAFPGDIIGLGHLRAHVSRAHAMVDTMVTMLTPAELDQALVTDHVLELQLAAAGELEFDYLRDRALSRTPAQPVVRMAQYLLAVARINEGRGRDADFILDENCSPFIAEMLNVSADDMGAALYQLQKQGLIAAMDGGLRILDLEALEQFAQGT